MSVNIFVMATARTAGTTRTTRPARAASRCCSVVDAPIDERTASELATAFQALADPVRLRLFSLIANQSEGEACACELVEPLGRSQPTISHHLSALTEAGLLEREKRGKWAWFRAVPERIAVLRDALGA